MKALTLTQPWATLVAIGAKRIETRSWKTDYRGKLAIHAAAGLSAVGGKKGYQALLAEEPFNSVLTAYMQAQITAGRSPLELANAIPFGAIVAICDLVAIRRVENVMVSPAREDLPYYIYGAGTWHLNDQERTFGDYTPGRYAWLLANVQKLETPIPAKGALGLWEWTLPANFTL